MVDLIEINDLNELEQYRLLWNALLPQTPRASFFHSFDWLKTYWQFFGGEQQLRVLVVYSAGKPIGIVPLCVRTEQYRIGNVCVLTYPMSDWGTWYGPIGPNPAATLFMAMKHLHTCPRDWDLLDLRWIGAEPGGRNPTAWACRAAGWQPALSDYQQVSLVQLEGTDWETYRANLSKKWRHELGRQQRKLERDFAVEFVRHRPLGANHGEDEPAWALYENCLEIAQQSWQGESTTGTTLSHGQVQDFLCASNAAAARLGMLDVVVLKLDSQPAAFQYNYHYQGKLFGLRMGFDRNLAPLGVGKALMGWTLQDSFDRGDRVFDLGIGDYDFKRRFRTGTETSLRCTYAPWQAWRGKGVCLSQWIKSRWNAEVAAMQK